MQERKLPNEVIDKLIIKAMLQDSKYTATVSSVFEPNYFEDSNAEQLFSDIATHFKQYNTLPSATILKSTNTDNEDIANYLNEVDSYDFNLAENYDFLFNETNLYLKEQALKHAIMQGVDLIDKKEDPVQYRNIVEKALCKDINIDLGENYFNDISERLRRIFTNSEKLLPSYFPMMDEFISGGFPKYTLSVMLARIHGGKSNWLVNMAARQVMHGHNPVICTLEMSQDAVCQRLDSIFSNQDINRMYITKNGKSKLMDSIKKVKAQEGLGNLIVKEFATGSASVNDFRIFLRELQYRGINPSCLFVDYINLMKPEYKNKGELYSDVKRISEELRALGLAFQIPIISVSQLNRESHFVNLKNIDFTGVAESIGLAATCDFMCVIGVDEDELVYKSEIHYKVVKNRFGQMGAIGKFYIDKRSLKLYDESELDLFVKDAQETGDTREMARIRD